jgi:hypothetical protein
LGLSKHYAYLILKPASATPVLRGNGGLKGFFALFLLVSGKSRLLFAGIRKGLIIGVFEKLCGFRLHM